MRVRGGALLLVLGVSLGVAGCSAEAEPTPLPPVPSASPSPTPLAVPPEAMAETAEGAEAFARYFFQVVSDAFTDANVTALQAISAPDCEGCQALIESVRGLKSKQQRRLGGNYLVRDVAAPPIENGDVIVEVSYTREAAEIVDAAGSVVTAAEPVPLTFAQMRLVRDQDGWVVQGYRVVKR